MPRALVIDDEKKTREVFKQFLKEENFQVFEAENGEQANLLLLQEKNLDLILLDIRMPVIDGSELFDIIKLRNPNVKVIVASVYPIDDQRRVIDGADGYFDKSEGPDILRTRLRKFFPSAR